MKQVQWLPPHRLTSMALVILLVAVLSACSPTGGQSGEGETEAFPSQSIDIIMPFGAGGGGDVLLREAATIMTKNLDQGVGVVNRTGGGGAVGWQKLAAAEPDGYTVGYISSSVLFKTHLEGSIDYNDYAPLGMFNARGYSIAVKADAPWDSVEDLVSHAADNPGEVQVSNGGTGSIWHVAAVLFGQEAGVEFTHVPYKGGAEAAAALAGGHVDATFVSPGELQSLVEGGELKLLAVGAENPPSIFPDAPTVQELGYDATLELWSGVAAPQGVAEDRMDILEQAFAEAFQSSRYEEFSQGAGFDVNYRGADAFAQAIADSASDLEPILEDLQTEMD